MMKVKIFIGNCLFFFCCLLLGCGVRKEMKREVWRQEAVQTAIRDCLQIRELDHVLATRQLQVKHIVFSPPDSMDRQYLERVILVEEVSEEEWMAEKELERTTDSERVGESVSYIEEKVLPVRRDGWLRWSFVCLAVIGIGIWAWRRFF